MGLCSGEVKWKREVIQDHSFDYVDPRDFRSRSVWLHIKYLFMFILVVQSVLIYASDFWTAFNLAFNYEQTKAIYFQDKEEKWFRPIFLASIGVSFLLAVYELRKAYIILRSRDISFTYTNVIAHRIYILNSYSNFCFFERIGTNKFFSDFVSFYVFFTLKGWKRVLFAQAPREVIKMIIIYYLIRASIRKDKPFDFNSIPNISKGGVVSMISIISLVITNILFIFSILQIMISGLLYIPLLFKIQGNLKEYCCHKIDKRITKLLQTQSQKRIKENEVYKLGHLKKESESLIKPTLPKIQLDEDDRSTYSHQSTNSTTTLTGGKVSKNGVRPFSPSDQTVSSRSNTPTSEGNAFRNAVRSPTHQHSFSGNSNASGGYRPPPSVFSNGKNSRSPPF